MSHILIVDDDLNILKATQMFLESHGYEISVAENGNEALSILEDCAIDLLIIDLFMPDYGGLHTLSHMKNMIPIIAISGEMENRLSDAQVTSSLNVDVFIQKPVSPDYLLGKVTFLLGK